MNLSPTNGHDEKMPQLKRIKVSQKDYYWDGKEGRLYTDSYGWFQFHVNGFSVEDYLVFRQKIIMDTEPEDLQGLTIEKIADAVYEYLKVKKESVFSKSRCYEHLHVRYLIFLLVSEFVYPKAKESNYQRGCMNLAKYSDISHSAVSVATRKAEKLTIKNADFKERYIMVRDFILKEKINL